MQKHFVLLQYVFTACLKSSYCQYFIFKYSDQTRLLYSKERQIGD